MRKTRLWPMLGVLLLVAVCYLPVYVLSPDTVARIGDDDQPIEYAGAIACLLASAIFFACYWKDPTGNDFHIFRTKRNLFLLFLGLLAVALLGEEISWGQRIFNYATPPTVVAHNVQDELNIHNLRWFDRSHSEGGLVNTSTLFNAFMLLYSFLIPAFFGLNSAFRRWIRRVNMPVVPVSLGIGYVVNELVFKLTAYHMPTVQRVQEFTEMISEILIMLMAISLLTELRNRRAARLDGISDSCRDRSDAVPDRV